MKKIGKYDLIRVLGSGATSSVYLAHDSFAQREVAIKVAFPEILKHPERGQLYTHLFLNEASLVGRLQHPHIAGLLDGGVDEHNAPWFVMPRVEGERIDRWCDARALDVRGQGDALRWDLVLSKAQVEASYGAPSDKIAAVGQPPISRWVYPGFTVYFEYDHVVHAVLTPGGR